jgi:hypothetical protein
MGNSCQERDTERKWLNRGGLQELFWRSLHAFERELPSTFNAARAAYRFLSIPRLLGRYKGTAELRFWKTRFEKEGRILTNDHYRKIMLAMAEEDDTSFLSNKIVADFGCGPRGSLVQHFIITVTYIIGLVCLIAV